MTHRPARSVNASRDGAILGSFNVHVFTGHDDVLHSQRCLRHNRRVGRPYGPEFVTHAPGGGTGNAEGWISMAKQMSAALPDNVTEINDIFASGDRVTVRYSCTGTQTGDLFGVPASNRQLVTGGIEIYRFDGERVVECWGQYDMSQLFTQQ